MSIVLELKAMFCQQFQSYRDQGFQKKQKKRADLNNLTDVVIDRRRILIMMIINKQIISASLYFIPKSILIKYLTSTC